MNTLCDSNNEPRIGKSENWQKYRIKHRWNRVTDFPAGIEVPKKIRIYRRNKHHILQWWDPQVKKNLTDRVNGDIVSAISRAREIESRIQNFRSSGVQKRCTNHDDLVASFLNHLQSRRDAGEIDPKTVVRYTSALGHYSNFIRQFDIEKVYPRASRVDRQFVLLFQSYLQNLLIAPNGHQNCQKRPMKSPSYVLDVTRSMYLWASNPDEGNLLTEGFRNPFLGRHRSSKRTQPDLFGEPDITLAMAEEFLSGCDTFQLRLFSLYIFYGLRASEPCFLFREQITQDGWLRVVCQPLLGYVSKGRRDKRFPLIDPLTALFSNDLNGEAVGLLFQRRAVLEENEKLQLANISLEELQTEFRQRCEQTRHLTATKRDAIRNRLFQDAGGMNYDHIQREYSRLARRLNWPKDATLKDFRHLFNTTMQNAGMPEFYRKYLMGHAVSKAAITSYTHLNELREQYEKAVQLKFESIRDTVVRRMKQLDVLEELMRENESGPSSTLSGCLPNIY